MISIQSLVSFLGINSLSLRGIINAYIVSTISVEKSLQYISTLMIYSANPVRTEIDPEHQEQDPFDRYSTRTVM